MWISVVTWPSEGAGHNTPMSTECAEHLTILLATFKELGVPVAAEKLEGPATRLVF